MERREFIRTAGLASAVLATGGRAENAPAQGRFEAAMREIEHASGGRIGVAILDSQSGTDFSHRGRERFPLCSTYKFLVAAQVLSRVDSGQEQATRRVPVRAIDLVEYSPITQPRVGGPPMTMAELCEAAITLSDNTAGNLLLRSVGGPPALTAYARSLGDSMTRLDRNEPTLNEATPGDLRDTTTPDAMLRTLQKIVLGDALSPASREQMLRWLRDNKTGDRKLRAQLPAGWQVGDKTGGGARGTNNDIGLLWPPGRAPLLVCCYLTDTSAELAVRDHAIADVGRLAASLVAP